ncbi:MAG TPA: EAL domain-containing protein [Ilumatobacter sp.]|nr:EAL domain-containing protein [Ilumatobacter sp.]
MRRIPFTTLAVSVVGLALVVAYLTVAPSRSTELFAAGVPALAALVTLVSVAATRPTRPGAWVVVACGMGMYAVARLAAAEEWYGDTGPVFPGAYHATIVLAYPALALGILGTRPTQRRDESALGGAEPIIYAAVATALVWLAFTGPYVDGEGLALPRGVWVAVSPVLTVLIAVLVWVRLTPYPHNHQIRLAATAGALVVAGGDLVFGAVWATEGLTPGGWVAALWMLGPLVVAVVMATPQMRVVMHMPAAKRPASWSQLVALLVVSVGALAVLVMAAALAIDSLGSRIAVCTAAGLVVLLAVVESRRLAAEILDYVDSRGAERLGAMVEHSTDVVLLSDQFGTINYASPGLTATLGREPADVVGHHVLTLLSETERLLRQPDFEQLVAAESGTKFEFESDAIHTNGHSRRVTAVVANLLGNEAVRGIITTLRDVTDQRNLERQLSHRAFHDELTGLANRALFLDRMDHALRVTRSEADPVVVLFVDLDDFKSVNDSLGHASGDLVLQAVAGRIRRAAGTGDTAARLGGDEFALLLEDRGGIDRAINVAEALLAELADPVRVGDHEVAVLASVGVAVAAPGMSTSSLLRDADVAMYEAKRAGKGQIRIFDPAMRLVASKLLAYRGQLGAALDNGELRLVYMPYVDLRSGQVTGAEALVRWHHPEFGEIPAGEFIPIAERTGVIVPMGYWILEQGLVHATGWRSTHRLYVSFNVSPVQLRQPEFVDTLIGMVEQYRVDPRLVVLEVTEAVLAEESQRMRDTFERLSKFGVRFAVDDFGSGTASLNYVQRYPVDFIKIDSQAIAASGGSGPSLTRVILQMAESLDVLTVAEGVETTGQLHQLRHWGCDLGQGYLLSHPLEADEIATRFGPNRQTGTPRPA